MKRIAVILALVTLLVSAIPVGAQEMLPPDPNRSGDFTSGYMGEKILVDVFVVRPISFAASLIGLIGSVGAYPMASLSGSTDRVTDELVRRPWNHTFCRPVGDIDF